MANATEGGGAELESTTAPFLQRGAQVGRYVVVRRLGAGSMGVVLSAYDPQLERIVALKLLNRETAMEGPAGRARLLREAQTMARLSHPNVVSVFDVGTVDSQVFLAMEYVSSGTLRAWLAAQPRSQAEVLSVFLEAGRGLAAAHAAGIVHRDFKPDNVLLDASGRAKVIDFGLARRQGSSVKLSELPPQALAAIPPLPELSATGDLMGTPAFMSPEMHLGRPVDHRCDQFAFCVALYLALYGEHPFAGSTMAALAFNVTSEQVRPVPKGSKVPFWLRTALLRGLSADPDLRFPSMEALLAALQADPRPKRRRALVLAVTGLAVAGLAVAVAVAISATAQGQIEQVCRHAPVMSAPAEDARCSTCGRERK